RLGEVLVLVADLRGRVDVVDARLAAHRAEDRGGEVGEAPGGAAADVEESVHGRMVVKPEHHVDGIADIDEVAFPATILDTGAVRAEETRRLAAGGAAIDLHGDALHRAFVVLVGPEDIEEFETRPLRRARSMALQAPRQAAVEEMLRPAIGVERPQAGE